MGRSYSLEQKADWVLKYLEDPESIQLIHAVYGIVNIRPHFKDPHVLEAVGARLNCTVEDVQTRLQDRIESNKNRSRATWRRQMYASVAYVKNRK